MGPFLRTIRLSSPHGQKARSKVHADEVTFKDTHKLCHERLEVENHFTAQTYAVLVETGPPHDLGLQAVVDFGEIHEFPTQGLDHHRGRDAVGEEVVEFGADRQDHGRRAFLDHVPGDLLDQDLPVRRGDGGLVAGFGVLGVDGLEHQQGPPQVPARLAGDAFVQRRHRLPVFSPGRLRQGVDDLGLRGRGDADEQRPRPDGRDDAGRAVGHEDQPDVGAVLLHRAAQGGLRVAAEPVGFVDDHDLEPLPRGQVDLLRLRHLFQQFLDHHPVVRPHVARRDLEVVHGRDDVEFEFPVRRGREHARVDLDLFHPAAVQGPEGREDTGLFTRARGSIEEEMREIS